MVNSVHHNFNCNGWWNTLEGINDFKKKCIGIKLMKRICNCSLNYTSSFLHFIILVQEWWVRFARRCLHDGEGILLASYDCSRSFSYSISRCNWSGAELITTVQSTPTLWKCQSNLLYIPALKIQFTEMSHQALVKHNGFVIRERGKVSVKVSFMFIHYLFSFKNFNRTKSSHLMNVRINYHIHIH